MKFFIPVLISLCIIFLFYVKRFIVLKFYPSICNCLIFFIFFSSLFAKETVIQKFAKVCGDELNARGLQDTRIITYVWCIFTFLNLLVSISTIFLPDRIWILYNGFLSYIMIGLLFGVEYFIRIILRKKGII